MSDPEAVQPEPRPTTREEFNALPSRGLYACPDCGSKRTQPYPNCGCPPSPTGYGTRHVNRWHHACEAKS